MILSNTPSFFKTHPRTCVLVLATSKGSRLFPITSNETPKHLLPIAGIPCILRLLESMDKVSQFVVAVSAQDTQTLSVLKTVGTVRESNENGKKVWILDVEERSQTIVIVEISENCFGPIDAVREVEETKIIHPLTRLCVLPGDLIFLQKDLNLDPLLRPSSDSSCTALLVDVGEVDEHGVPLKESAKAKKGGFARELEDIEYIGLSYSSAASKDPSILPKIVLKQSKLEVETDEDMTGNTAKLQVPKARLRHGRLVVKTSWSDVHVYSIAPWIRHLIQCRKSLSSFQEDLLPLLISRQFRGKRATFGKSLGEDGGEGADEKQKQAEKFGVNEEPFVVSALVLPGKTVLRANTFSSYHYACRETVANGAVLTMPKDSKRNGKFQALVLRGAVLGAKINMHSSVVGMGCELGAKCRLNNVVIMDGAIIGENCTLQNTLVGAGAKLGNNCSLNDCQVGPGKEIPAGTKEKGEAFMVGDAMEEDLL